MYVLVKVPPELHVVVSINLSVPSVPDVLPVCVSVPVVKLRFPPTSNMLAPVTALASLKSIVPPFIKTFPVTESLALLLCNVEVPIFKAPPLTVTFPATLIVEAELPLTNPTVPASIFRFPDIFNVVVVFAKSLNEPAPAPVLIIVKSPLIVLSVEFAVGVPV